MNRALLALLLVPLLAACGSTPTPSGNPGITPPTTVNVPYLGEWALNAISSNGAVIDSGLVSISQKQPDSAAFTDGGMGTWRWSTPSGLFKMGFACISTFHDGGKSYLWMALLSNDGHVFYGSLDADNIIGNEILGKPTFHGPGLVTYLKGGTSYPMDVYLTKISDTPSLSGTAYMPDTFSLLSPMKVLTLLVK